MYLLAELRCFFISEVKGKTCSCENVLVEKSESSTRNSPISGTSVCPKHPNPVKGMSIKRFF